MTNAWALRPLTGTMTASSTAAGFDPSYVLNDYAGVVWKSNTGSSTQSIVIDLGAAAVIDAALFFGCTGATTSWTLTVESASNSGFSSGLVTNASGIAFLAGATFPSHGRGVGYWEASSAPAARRFWRFTFGSLSSAAVTVARLAVGTKVQLGRNFAFGGAFGVRDLGKTDWSASGTLLRRRAAKLRTMGISFPWAYKDEIEQKVAPLIELSAGQEPIALVTDPSPDTQRQTRCWMGPLIGEIGTVWRNAGAWEWRVNLVDLIPIPRSA